MKTVDISGLRLNSQSLSVAWTSISGTEYSRGEVPVDNGRTYNLAHEDPLARFMALLYGSADRESFYFPIDVGMANINVSNTSSSRCRLMIAILLHRSSLKIRPFF